MNKSDLRRYVLDNAVSYKGKANLKAVVGHLIGNFPNLKKDMKKFMKELNKLVDEINSLSFEELI